MPWPALCGLNMLGLKMDFGQMCLRSAAQNSIRFPKLQAEGLAAAPK
jgi:hypothetical protein